MGFIWLGVLNNLRLEVSIGFASKVKMCVGKGLYFRWFGVVYIKLN